MKNYECFFNFSFQPYACDFCFWNGYYNVWYIWLQTDNRESNNSFAQCTTTAKADQDPPTNTSLRWKNISSNIRMTSSYMLPLSFRIFIHLLESMLLCFNLLKRDIEGRFNCFSNILYAEVMCVGQAAMCSGWDKQNISVSFWSKFLWTHQQWRRSFQKQT